MESLREPVYKNYSSGSKKETFSDAHAALETAALVIPAPVQARGRLGTRGLEQPPATCRG